MHEKDLQSAHNLINEPDTIDLSPFSPTFWTDLKEANKSFFKYRWCHDIKMSWFHDIIERWNGRPVIFNNLVDIQSYPRWNGRRKWQDVTRNGRLFTMKCRPYYIPILSLYKNTIVNRRFLWITASQLKWKTLATLAFSKNYPRINVRKPSQKRQRSLRGQAKSSQKGSNYN